MSRKPREKRKGLNLFQRISIGMLSIVTAAALTLTGVFFLYYSARAEESVSTSTRLISENNAKEVANVFGRTEIAMESMSTATSGVCEQLMVYNGDAQSCVKSFQQTRELISNYISVAIRPITQRYHGYFFVDRSFELYEKLTVVDVDTPTLDGQTWMYSDTLVADQPWYQTARAEPNISQWFLRDTSGTLYMARCLQYMTVVNSAVQNVTLGVLLIKLDTAWLSEYVDFSELTADTLFLLLDRDNRILYAADTDRIGETYKADTTAAVCRWDGRNYAQETTPVEPGMQLVTLIPSAERMQSTRHVYTLFGAVLVLVLLASGIFGIVLSRRIASPILDLAKHMRTQQMAHIAPAHPISDDDVRILYQSYNDLVDQVQESIRKKLEYAHREKELELRVMQAQINPHFLCNSLNTVYNLATLHNEPEIARAVSSLCVFLRYNISAPQIEIPLQRELDMLENYITLQNFLLGDRVLFDYDIRINCDSIRIPKMLLQPLVENCILHGMHDGGVDIRITCRFDDRFFTLMVADDGDCDIAAINKRLEGAMTESDLKAHGFGVRNVNQRIQMRYGPEYGLHFEKNTTNDTVACIQLPIDLITFSRPAAAPVSWQMKIPDF